MIRLMRRGCNLFVCLWNYAHWAWRFGHFGWRSRLGRCDKLTNPRAIHLGKKVTIWKGARLEAVGPEAGSTPKLEIGDGTTIHLYFHCGAARSVKIGRNVLIAGRVYISDHDHRFDHPEFCPAKCPELDIRPVIIEDGVWLGEGCVVLKGVTVGERAVVGANAVVTRDVPPYTIVGGVPARPIREIQLGRDVL